jgi:hypothetical protein
VPRCTQCGEHFDHEQHCKCYYQGYRGWEHHQRRGSLGATGCFPVLLLAIVSASLLVSALSIVHHGDSVRVKLTQRHQPMPDREPQPVAALAI